MQGAGGRGLSSARGGENAQGKRPLAATRFNGNALQRQRAALCEARHTHAERLIAKKGGERWPHRVADQERHTPRRHGVHQPPAGVGAVATWQRTEVGMQHTLGGGGSEPLAVSTSEQQTASSRQQQRAADSSSEQRQRQRAQAHVRRCGTPCGAMTLSGQNLVGQSLEGQRCGQRFGQRFGCSRAYLGGRLNVVGHAHVLAAPAVL